MEKNNLSQILLNFKKIKIATSLLNKCCFSTLSLHKNEIEKLKNFHFYMYDIYSDVLKNTNKIEITRDGLFLIINPSLKQIEHFYNIDSNDKNIKNIIDRLQQQLKQMNNKEELSQISSLLEHDYELFYEKKKKVYLKKHKEDYVKNLLFRKFIKLQIHNLKFLSNQLDNNFENITNCNNLLEFIDKDKLGLLIAYQIMSLNQRHSQSNTLIYLKNT